MHLAPCCRHTRGDVGNGVQNNGRNVCWAMALPQGVNVIPLQRWPRRQGIAR